MKFSKNDEVIVDAQSYPDRDKLGFECIKLPDGQCIHKNNVLIIDRIIDDNNVKCVFKKFRDDQPTREYIVPTEYLKHSAKNLGVGSKVQFIPGVRCVQSGKVGRIVKIDPSGVYHFERDDKKGTTYECRSYELIDINDNINLNFSARLRKCFSNSEYYTQTYEVSVTLDLSKHPEMNPKSHQADEDLPESLIDDLKSIGVKCNKSGFNDDKSKYTILEFDIERKPRDRYDEVIKFITNKLVEYGFDKNRIRIVKWD